MLFSPCLEKPNYYQHQQEVRAHRAIKRQATAGGQMAKWTLRVILSLIGLIVVLLIAGFTYETWSEARDARLYVPPGQMISVGDHNLHILCKGAGDGPVVVIEAGGGVGLVSYLGVQAKIAEFAHVCTYDRAGLGWSQPARTPRTFEGMASELEALLNGAKISTPCVLVGHSYGGLIVRVFARDYASRVAGLVLVETGDEAIAFDPSAVAAFTRGRQRNEAADIMHRFGIVRPVPALLGPFGDAPPEIKAAILRPGIFKAIARESEAYDRIPVSQRRPGGYGTLDDWPVAVVVRGHPDPSVSAEFEQAWQETNRRLASLSTNSVLIVAEKSGHNVQRDEPEVFVDAVRRVHDAVRDGTRLPPP